MRIAMISYHTCPLATLGGKDTGGMNVYVKELTLQLGMMGVHVDVFTRSQDEHVPHVLHDLGYGNRVVHIPAGPEIPLPKNELLAYVPDFSKEVLAFTRRKGLRYDLIHSHYWLSGLAASDLQAEWGLPIVHMFHTLGEMKVRVTRSEDADPDQRIQEETRVLKEAERVVAATPAEVAQLKWLYRADTSKIVVIPPGVDLSHFYPIPEDEAKEYVGIAEDDQMLLYVGRIEPLKGVDTLLRALALMREAGVLERYRLCLAIIGGEPGKDPQEMSEEMARLKSISREYGLVDLVTFMGMRSQESLPYYYSAAAVVVMPSLYESFGMVALESMACGTPVVASQVGGLAFLIRDGETGFLVPDQEPEALADRLTTLVENPTLREEMGDRAETYVQQYAWEIIAEQIGRVYEDVLVAQPPG